MKINDMKPIPISDYDWDYIPQPRRSAIEKAMVVDNLNDKRAKGKGKK